MAEHFGVEVDISEDGASSTYHYGKFVTPTAEQQMRHALKRMDWDVVKAGNLFAAWMQQDPSLREQIVPQLVADWLTRNLDRIKAEEDSAK